MSQGATISIMMIMVMVMVGLGIYLTNREKPKKNGSCSGSDSNASYKYNDKGQCAIDKCNSGYVLADNGVICITSNDSDSNGSSGSGGSGSGGSGSGGSGSLDCTIDGYTYGQCKNTETGQVLTGDQGNCGDGTREKYPNITIGATGGGGTCEENTIEDCEVPCRDVCTAPDDLWVTDDNAECRAIRDGQSVVLGSDSGYCGQGTKVKTLTLPETMNLEEYKTNINFSYCEPEKVEACSVSCENNLIDVGCPTSLNSWDWVYANDGAVYTEESANQVINREITFNQAVLMPAVSRQEAINSGALNQLTGEIDAEKIPLGKKIKFKAGENHSYDYLTEQNCSIVELEDTRAPRIAENCVIEDVAGQCESVGCGMPQQKKITPTVTSPAWGTGTCIPGREFNEICPNLNGPQCCYGNGDWKPEGSCGEYVTNKQRYKQTTTGVCPPGTDTMEEDCIPDKNCIVQREAMQWKEGTQPKCGRGGCSGTKPVCAQLVKYKITQERVGAGDIPCDGEKIDHCDGKKGTFITSINEVRNGECHPSITVGSWTPQPMYVDSTRTKRVQLESCPNWRTGRQPLIVDF